MSVNAVSQANGADLLSLLSAGQGQGPTAVTASAEVLKKAIAVAQVSEQELVSEIDNIGQQLNVFA
jgi:hypothetical protein